VFGTLAVGLVTLATVAILASPAVRYQLRLSFTQVPTQYAQLYFQDPASLPQQARTGEVVAVTFAITNMGPRSDTYRYVAKIETANGPTITEATGMVGLASKGRAEVPVTFVVPPSATSFTVTLPGRSNIIFFPFARDDGS
jgi:hypothetical protein